MFKRKWHCRPGLSIAELLEDRRKRWGTGVGFNWFKSRNFKAPGQRLYWAVAAVARHRALFKELAVPDTFDGRFDAVVLHLALVMRRLESLGDEGHMLARQAAGIFFDDMDQTVRELGVGDLSVGKQVKRMARALYGRLKAYDLGLRSWPEEKQLEEALGRNIYAGREQAAGVLVQMASYVAGLNRWIEDKSLDDFLQPGFSDQLSKAAGDAARKAAA